MPSAVENRYAQLVTTGGSLSCGKALSFVEARPGDVCLDLGSGRGGDVLKLAAKVGPTGRALGVDATPAMVTQARARAQTEGVTNAAFLHGELSALDLPSASVDWVVSNCALNHAQDKAAVWREIARVLRSGGRFVVSDIYAVDPIAQRWRDDPKAVAECWAGAETREATLAHVEGAGLVDVAVLEESAPYDKGHARIASFTVSGRAPARAALGQPATLPHRDSRPPSEASVPRGHGQKEGEVNR